MGYVFKKNYTKEFEIEKVKKFFMNFNAFSNVRKDIANCDLCDKEFKNEDNTNLAFVKNGNNKLICDDCATKIVNEGVNEIN